ncbi:MAG: PqqD family protein [Saprospiraceae bacterium]|nr:PqqD family protein [Saprospiraceae bacterium]
MKLKNNIAIAENGFIFNAARGDSFTTNPIGIFILQGLKNNWDKARLCQEILVKYEIDEATCEKDLYDFLKMLKHYDLIEE